jgi:hypothetical protein
MPLWLGTKPDPPADRVTDKNLGEVLSAQGKEMSEIRSNIAALSNQMAAIMEEVKRNRMSCPFEV